ncbi:MAG: hypothetical protein WC477_00630 [Patescibacteria group bacterium]
MVELIVSVAVIMLISLAVVGDIARTRQQAELSQSTYIVQNEMRNMQADALAARSIKTCPYSSTNVVCEYDPGPCRALAQTCSGLVSPPIYGAVYAVNATGVREFADVYAADFAENQPYEAMKFLPFVKANSGSKNVIISSVVAGGVSVGQAVVAFQRQNGMMRINGCASMPCAGEVQTLTVTLKHIQTNKTKDIVFNAITGRVNVQ